MSGRTLEELELCITVNGTDRNKADVFTDDPVWIARFDKKYTAYKITAQGRWYSMPVREILRVNRLTNRAAKSRPFPGYIPSTARTNTD